ncbi:MAG TPA: glutathione S-transferase family protein [Kofleriaceae bacterium]|nr:glutathione S-transferase family protein [Kofleriaceae bacterium]
MSLVLYYHPFSRAANAVWMLEEIGQPYELRFVDILKGEQKSKEITAVNPMGKIPALTDGDTVVTEGAAIALYLGDRYGYGTLAPKVDDPRRGPYLRWALFAPSVIEPAVSAKAGNWPCKDTQVGWGTFENVLDTMESALAGRDFLLGDQFSMADIVFGGTVRYMMMVKAIEARPTFTAYAERLAARPAAKRAEAVNAEQIKAHNIKFP